MDKKQQQHDKAGRHPAQHGHGAPGNAGEGDHRFAPDAVRQAADGEAEQGVEDGKGDARQQADLGVADVEFELDGLDEDGDDETVDVVEDVDHRQHHQRVVRMPCDALRSALA